LVFIFTFITIIIRFVVGHRAPRSWDKYTLFGLFATKKFKSIKRFNKINKFLIVKNWFCFLLIWYFGYHFQGEQTSAKGMLG